MADTDTYSAPLQAMLSVHSALLDQKGRNRAPNRGCINLLLEQLLRDLIVYGAKFAIEDFEQIDRKCGAYSTNGKFEPLGLDVYATALGAGNSSAADSWEAAGGWEAWGWSGEHLTSTIANRRERTHQTASRGPSPLRRVGPSSAIKIDGEWWRVYEISANLIKIAQYPGDDGATPDTLGQRTGSRRQRLDRSAWEKLAKSEGALHRESVCKRLTLQVDVPARVRAHWGGEETGGVLPAGTVLRPTNVSALERAARLGAEEYLLERANQYYTPSYTASMDAWRAALPHLPKPGQR